MRKIRLFLCLFTVLALASTLACATDPDVTSPELLLFDSVVVTSEAAFVPAAGGTTQISAKVFGTNGKPLADVIVTFQTTAGEFQPGDRTVTNARGEATVTLQTSKRAQVSARVGELRSGGQTVDIDSPVTMTIDAELGEIGSESSFELTASREDGLPVIGRLDVDFGDGTQTAVEDFTNETTLEHTYDDAGTFTFRVDLTQAAGQTDTEESTFELEEPEPEPDPDPDPSPAPSGDDELDLNTVTFLHADISGWNVTSKVESVQITGSNICIRHTKAGQWPVWNGVEGNPWVFVNRGGQWYGATYEWLRPGQICKGITASNIGPHIKQPPLNSWRPQSGEVVGFAVSTLARGNERTSNERSNVVLVIWP